MSAPVMNKLVNGIIRRELRSAAARHMSGRLLDIGCGTKPYAAMLSEFVEQHIGVDHEGSTHGKNFVDLIGTAYHVPVTNTSFDCVLCSAVLEHLEEPEKALRECFRVLKPGGKAIYLVPFIWHLHEQPRDFYRFTKYGLHYLFTKVGFSVVELKALSGFWVTFGQLLVYKLHPLNRGFLRWLRLMDALELAIQGASYVADHLDRAEKWTWMYLVVAVKPQQEIDTSKLT